MFSSKPGPYEALHASALFPGPFLAPHEPVWTSLLEGERGGPVALLSWLMGNQPPKEQLFN